ncbi:hypothetical protein LDENG_00222530 [Lucifuga dentata]|nr:hypothetical protein LDENG_00222530 [Lucifuga dentata]
MNLCFRISFSNKEILSLLVHKHSLVISIRILKQLCQRLGLFRRKNQTWRKWPYSCRPKQLEMDRCKGIDGYTCAQYKEDVLYHKTQ